MGWLGGMPVQLLLIFSKYLLCNHNRIALFQQMANIYLMTSIIQFLMQASHDAFFEKQIDIKSILFWQAS